MLIGMSYDLRDDYLREGYSELETAELDQAETIDVLEATLAGLGHQVVRIGNLRSLANALLNGERWDLVFNICEGMHGLAREAQVPALLDAWQIPYTFSDALVCALTLHKGMTKRVVMSHGVPSPAFVELNCEADIEAVNLPFPVFAKPIAEGTGKGITAASRITCRSQLRRVCRSLLRSHNQPVLVEAFLPGREFTTGVLGTGAQARTVATMEVVLGAQADAEVYTYHNKENWRQLVSYRLLDDPDLAARIEQVVLDAWRCLGCRDGGRIDIRLDAQGQPHFLEVNPLAGLHHTHSDLPILAGLAGMTYPQLVEAIVTSAAYRVKSVTPRLRRIA